MDCVSERKTTENTLTPLGLETCNNDTKAVVVAFKQTSVLVTELRIPEGLNLGICAPCVLIYAVNFSVKPAVVLSVFWCNSRVR
jgi:hypothetical protein